MKHIINISIFEVSLDVIGFFYFLLYIFQILPNNYSWFCNNKKIKAVIQYSFSRVKHIKQEIAHSGHDTGGIRLPASNDCSHTLPLAIIKHCYPARKSTHWLPKHMDSLVFLSESYSFMKPRADRMAE